uniref:Protein DETOXIFICATION n=1 Tax=Noccaea caerulescens TaxID=107243 RepID=A0A1J3I3Q6_NOCCA
MEDPLLVGDEQLITGNSKPTPTWRMDFTAQLKNVSRMAAPMATVTVSQYLVPVISVMVAGHQGELQLSSVALATSFANVSGFSIMNGLVGALETLCGQAYGAKQYAKLGTYAYSAVFSNVPICFLISMLWIFLDKLLISIGQDPDISKLAGSYIVWLIPALFAQVVQQPLNRFLQTQGLVLPLLYCALTTLLFHVPVCWTLVYTFGFGSNGAAFAISLSYWFSVLLLVFYVRLSSSCVNTRRFVSDDFVSCVKQFFHYGIPSAAMTCLEWWLFELLTLFSGLLPNPKLETSVLSICITTGSLHYVISQGIAAAASTRISNELGAGKPEVARLVVFAGICLWLLEATICSTILFICRNIFGYAFSNSKEVVDYVTEISPLLCLSFIVDGFSAILGGVARGSGWQHSGAWATLVAYYLIGAPVGLFLGFWCHLNGKGLWIGVVLGSTAQGIILAIITACMSWEVQASKARNRILVGTSPIGSGLA